MQLVARSSDHTIAPGPALARPKTRIRVFEPKRRASCRRRALQAPEPHQENARGEYENASVGLLISSDPIRFGGGDTNLYAYCGNSPANCKDPKGLDAYHSYLGPYDPLAFNADFIRPVTNIVVGHANVDGFYGDLENDFVMNPDAIAERLMADRDYNPAKATALFACELAKEQTGRDFLNRIADITGMPAQGWTESVWIPEGKGFSGSWGLTPDGKAVDYTLKGASFVAEPYWYRALGLGAR